MFQGMGSFGNGNLMALGLNVKTSLKGYEGIVNIFMLLVI